MGSKGILKKEVIMFFVEQLTRVLEAYEYEVDPIEWTNTLYSHQN